jgi:hypothetical protein
LFFLNEVVKFFGFVSIRRKRKAQCINTYAWEPAKPREKKVFHHSMTQAQN